MAIGFDSQLFTVLLDADGRLPMPIPDEDGVLTYAPDVLIDSLAAYAAILALHSTVTIVAGMGGGGVLVTERGPGPKTLTYPSGNALEASRYAILTGFEGSPFNSRDTARAVTLTFVLGDPIP